jgi:hypothetical protein
VDKPRQEENRNKRPNQKSEKPPSSELWDWGKKLARATNTKFVEDQLHSMVDGEADGEADTRQDRRADERRQGEYDDAYEEFHQLSNEAEDLEDEVNEVAVPEDATREEANAIEALRDRALEQLGNTQVEAGRRLLTQLKDLAEQTARAVAQRRERCLQIKAEAETITAPPKASKQEATAIDDLRKQTVDASGAQQADDAARLLAQLKNLLAATVNAIAQREAMSRELAALARIFNRMNKLTTSEWSALDKQRSAAQQSIERKEASEAQNDLKELRRAIEVADTTTDHKVLVARLDEAVGKNSKDLMQAIFIDCVNAGIDFSPKPQGSEVSVQTKLKLRTAGILASPDGQKKEYDSIEAVSGKPHAWERHTKEGIWAVNAVWTDHPTQVAIFASERDLDDAIGKAPRQKTKWKAKGPGRIDSDLGGVHYQGVELGNTVSLFSCYPLGGKQFLKADVEAALREAISFRQFCEILDTL